VHYDPYDVTRVWIRNHRDGGWIAALWRQLHSTPQPFGDAAWQYARRIVAERDTNGPAEDTIKAAVDDLLDRAAPPPDTKPPKKTVKARRVAAQTYAANATRSAAAPTAPEISSLAAYLAPESDEPIADVIPLPVFDPDKEAESWW
jgi:hypothetical protein